MGEEEKVSKEKGENIRGKSEKQRNRWKGKTGEIKSNERRKLEKEMEGHGGI